MAELGDPLRVIEVTPVELPVPSAPEPLEPIEAPEHDEPVEVPA